MAFGDFEEDQPHAGRMALPHFHPASRTPNTHSLLLSDGHEIEVRFTALTVRLLDEIVTPVQLTDREKKWLTACPTS